MVLSAMKKNKVGFRDREQQGAGQDAQTRCFRQSDQQGGSEGIYVRTALLILAHIT